MFCGKMVGPAVTFFLFSLFSVPFCLNRCRDFMLQPKAVGKAAHVVFFLPITLGSPGCQGRICKKCTSKRKGQARRPIFAAIKPDR